MLPHRATGNPIHPCRPCDPWATRPASQLNSDFSVVCELADVASPGNVVQLFSADPRITPPGAAYTAAVRAARRFRAQAKASKPTAPSAP